ncbi:MAG: hypothetical protein IJ587_06350 [Synergistaceae bacterium]|nr:hypothetical protein [Synergistaceae bacterium]
MIGTLITVLVVAAVSGTVYGIWHYFADFVMDIVKSIAERVKRFLSKVFAGVKCFLKRVWGSIKEIIKSYTYDREKDKWTVTETTREVPPDEVENEIPADIRARVEVMPEVEHDVTDKVELKLKECA